MVHKAKDLAPEQRLAIETLLGRPVAENETISIRAMAADAAPEWLRESWESAKQLGLEQLSAGEIDEEIVAARKARGSGQHAIER